MFRIMSVQHIYTGRKDNGRRESTQAERRHEEEKAVSENKSKHPESYPSRHPQKKEQIGRRTGTKRSHPYVRELRNKE
jgi:hypothetical protein